VRTLSLVTSAAEAEGVLEAMPLASAQLVRETIFCLLREAKSAEELDDDVVWCEIKVGEFVEREENASAEVAAERSVRPRESFMIDWIAVFENML